MYLFFLSENSKQQEKEKESPRDEINQRLSDDYYGKKVKKVKEGEKEKEKKKKEGEERGKVKKKSLTCVM